MTIVNSPSTFSRESLLKQGPILEVVIGYKVGQSDLSNSLYALVDTGADDPVIGKRFASSLGLPVIRECEVAGATGKEEAIIYLGQIYVPSLEVGIYQEMIALDLQIAQSRDYQALLGRTFLQYFKMEYDGMTGAVTLRKNPNHFSQEDTGSL